MESLSKKDESKLDAFTSLLESFGGLDLDEPPEVEDKEILKASVKKTEKPKEISEVKIVDEVKVDDLPSDTQLKLSKKDEEKLNSFAGLMESFGALLDEPPQLEDEKIFEVKVEDIYPVENEKKIEEKKIVEETKLLAFEKLFTEFAKEQDNIDEEVLNLKITDIYPEKQDEDFTHYPAQVDPKKDKSSGWIKGDPTKPIMFDGSDGKTTKDIIKKANKEVERERKVKQEPYYKNPKDKVEETSDIIGKVIANLDSMKEKTDVKEQVDQISLLRNEFNQFRTVIQNQIANQKISYAGGGSGEVRLEFLDDVQRSTAKVDGKFLKYSSSAGKFIGSDSTTISDEQLQDVVGGMISSNTESGISVTYDDTNGKLDFTVGTLNQDTTGNAATATVLETARTIGGVSFNGSANINLPGVNTSGSQDTSGNAATATALETGRTINGTSFDGTANITVTAAAGTVTGSTLNSGVTASSLTSVGTLTTLTVDNVIINGTTIGHTDDTDLITLTDGVVTVAGEVSATTLDIGGTNIAATAAELNIMDGDTSATGTTLADADRLVLNDAGTMKQIALTDVKTYLNSAGYVTDDPTALAIALG